jgi:glutaminyl-peptide cyclotransferase
MMTTPVEEVSRADIGCVRMPHLPFGSPIMPYKRTSMTVSFHSKRRFSQVARRVYVGLILILFLAGCESKSLPAHAQVQMQGVTVVKEHPHDVDAFTQGLVVHDGKFYEGTGQYRKSTLRKVQINNGKVLAQVSLDQIYFGEGITILNGKIYQLTWKNNRCFVYDLQSMRFEKSMIYTYEGWGLTNDGKELIVSDGTANIRFVDPESFQEKRRIQVVDVKKPVQKINELEWVDGEIWANIWYEDVIARIAPDSGKVIGWVDMRKVYPMSGRERESVMNGIAYEPSTKRLFITGKNWPKVFEVQLNK